MANPFDSVTVRQNGDRILASWFNSLRTAGVNLGNQAGKWTKYTLAHTDFQTAATSNDIELFSLEALGLVEAVFIKHSTAFAGTGITAYTLSVGISGTLDKYALPFDVFQAVGDTVFRLDASGPSMENAGSATSIRVSAVSTGADLDQSSAGAVDIYVKTGTLSGL